MIDGLIGGKLQEKPVKCNGQNGKGFPGGDVRWVSARVGGIVTTKTVTAETMRKPVTASASG